VRKRVESAIIEGEGFSLGKAETLILLEDIGGSKKKEGDRGQGFLGCVFCFEVGSDKYWDGWIIQRAIVPTSGGTSL